MAQVTGLTAERMLEIEAASVVDGDVVGDNLVLTRHDGSTLIAGSVRGPEGDPASAQITPKLVGDLPSTYPTGVTSFTFGAENPGWPVTLGTVFSYIENIARGFQIVTEKASGATAIMWIRIVGQDVWGPFMKLVAGDSAGLVTMDRIRLTKTDDASETSTLHPFQIGPTTGVNMAIDDNEILGRNNGALSPIYFNGGLRTPIVPTDAQDVVNKAYSDTIRRIALAQRVMSGGGLRKVSSGGVSWSQRFIVMGMGQKTAPSAGYYEINMPPDGTVIPTYGDTAVTTTTVAGGIVPLAGWRALYYDIPFGATQTSDPSRFKIMTYSAATTQEIPPTWVLICTRNIDTMTANYLWGDGRVQDYWKLFTLKNGWVTYNTTFPSPGWRWTAEGKVETHGLMKSGTVGLSTPFATLPYAGMQPDGGTNSGLIVPVVANAGSYTARLDVLPPDGDMVIIALGTGATNGYVSLDNLSWHPAGT